MSQTKAIKLASFFTSRKWFTVPFLPVSSFEEYQSLSKSEKFWFGLYRVPYALPSEMFEPTSKGWNTFYCYIRSICPVQYFFREWLFSNDNPVIFAVNVHLLWPLQNAKRAIALWFSPVHPRWRKSLARHCYSDITELVVKSNFALICDFYYEEVLNGWVDWTSQEDHVKFYKELVDAVHWIEDTKADLESNCTNLLRDAISECRNTYKANYKELELLEKKIADKETEILTWFINNRTFFWT